MGQRVERQLYSALASKPSSSQRALLTRANRPSGVRTATPVGAFSKATRKCSSTSSGRCEPTVLRARRRPEDRLAAPDAIGALSSSGPVGLSLPAYTPRVRATSSGQLPAVRSSVPDVLAPGLDVVFCGINPGLHSQAKGTHFANPRNDFWRLLYAAGFTPRLVDPAEQDVVLAYGLGITNAALRTTRGSSDLRRADFAGSAERLERLALELRPRAIGFVGKEAFRGPFGGRPAHGLQELRLGSTHLFVLPSSSPANAAVPWDERLRWFRALRELMA